MASSEEFFSEVLGKENVDSPVLIDRAHGNLTPRTTTRRTSENIEFTDIQNSSVMPSK